MTLDDYEARHAAAAWALNTRQAAAGEAIRRQDAARRGWRCNRCGYHGRWPNEPCYCGERNHERGGSGGKA